MVSCDKKYARDGGSVKTRCSNNAVHKCASKLVNATSTCSDVKGDFVRPFQVMRRRLFQNLHRTTRSAQPKQLATFLACRVKEDHDDAMNSECHVFTTFTICVFSLGWCWLNISHNHAQPNKTRKPTPEGF